MAKEIGKIIKPMLPRLRKLRQSGMGLEILYSKFY